MRPKGSRDGEGGASSRPVNNAPLSDALSSEPPPVFPMMPHVPLGSACSTEELRMVDSLREFQNYWSMSIPLQRQLKSQTSDIERYSDKYTKQRNTLGSSLLSAMHIEWTMFPQELELQRSAASRAPVSLELNPISLVRAFDDVAGAASQELKDANADHQEQLSESDGYDEEIEEEGNDYITSYFDNGEGAAESDGDDNDGGEYI